MGPVCNILNILCEVKERGIFQIMMILLESIRPGNRVFFAIVVQFNKLNKLKVHQWVIWYNLSNKMEKSNPEKTR